MAEDLAKLQRDFDALKSGDVKAHIDVARRIKAAGKWNEDIGQMIVMGAGTTSKKLDQIRLALAEIIV